MDWSHSSNTILFSSLFTAALTGRTAIQAKILGCEIGVHDTRYPDPSIWKIVDNKEAAKMVGAMIAKRAIEKGITEVVFDRGGYLYHGRVQELAEGAREAGLKF